MHHTSIVGRIFANWPRDGFPARKKMFISDLVSVNFVSAKNPGGGFLLGAHKHKKNVWHVHWDCINLY